MDFQQLSDVNSLECPTEPSTIHQVTPLSMLVLIMDRYLYLILLPKWPEPLAILNNSSSSNSMIPCSHLLKHEL